MLNDINNFYEQSVEDLASFRVRFQYIRPDSVLIAMLENEQKRMNVKNGYRSTLTPRGPR